MEPNKLENQIKEKLNSREIQPSAQAWDRLDAMLSVTEEKKTRRPFGFLFIAASITILLTAGIFFLTQRSTEIKPQNNVVTTEIKDTVQKSVNKTPNPLIEENQKNKIVVSTQNKPTTDNQQPTTNSSGVSIINQKQSNNPNINRDKEIEYQNSSDVALKNLPVIETRKEIVLSNKSIPSDEDLLASLDNVAKQSSDKNALVKVNPKSLLSQADGELEQTFREKVITRISKNYKEVKVALANRNNE